MEKPAAFDCFAALFCARRSVLLALTRVWTLEDRTFGQTKDDQHGFCHKLNPVGWMNPAGDDPMTYSESPDFLQILQVLEHLQSTPPIAQQAAEQLVRWLKPYGKFYSKYFPEKPTQIHLPPSSFAVVFGNSPWMPSLKKNRLLTLNEGWISRSSSDDKKNNVNNKLLNTTLKTLRRTGSFYLGFGIDPQHESWCGHSNRSLEGLWRLAFSMPFSSSFGY